jgi:predicted MFS family arabinose efflux permease
MSMFSRRTKSLVFFLEGSNSYATTCYCSYFYFFAQRQFGFTNKANLMVAALGGMVYVPAAFWGGKFAQKAGYFTALKVGFCVMIASLLAGWLLATSATAQILLLLTTTVGLCFTWPTLEAMVSEAETPLGLQHQVGIYNVVWAGTNALAYFTGGAILDRWGVNGFFLVPAGMAVVQLALTFYLHRRHSNQPYVAPAVVPDEPPLHSPVKTRAFLRMAWLANPFAYIGINTLIAVMPGVAVRLGLTATQAGFYCSLWCFARLAAFFVLWFWTGWHYKFRWLGTSYLALIASFAVILIVPRLGAVAAAELVFGWAIGLIYYSSLYYSMHVGDTKGEHGGIHEAAIGLGNFVGPGVGAASLYFLPQYANSGAVAVSALLVCGLGGLLYIRRGNEAGRV